MARERLSKTDDWELVHTEQDIRGWRAVDASGGELGTVEDLTLDTEAKLVESITLDSGAEYPASEIEIGDEVVYVEGTGSYEDEEPVVRVYDDTEVRRREEG